MVSVLVDNDLITKEDLYELLQINKYRNLVFHGELETVNRGMMERVKSMTGTLDRILAGTFQTN